MYKTYKIPIIYLKSISNEKITLTLINIIKYIFFLWDAVVMKTFKEYLKNAKKNFKFRIKTIVPLTDDKMENIAKVLNKFDLEYMSLPKKTIFHTNPIDFENIQGAEVYIVDVVTHLPINSHVLRKILSSSLNIVDNYIVVRSENDPLEQEVINQEENEISDIVISDEKMASDALLNNPDYPEAQGQDIELYGEKYNMELLKKLTAEKTDEREEKTEKKDYWFKKDNFDMNDEKLERELGFTDDLTIGKNGNIIGKRKMRKIIKK